MNKVGLVFCAIAIAIQGCSDPKAASKSSFDAAFQNRLNSASDTGLCFKLYGYNEKNSTVEMFIASSGSLNYKLIKAYEIMRLGGIFNDASYSGGFYIFTLAESAKKSLTAPEEQTEYPMMGSVPSICAGKLVLDEVVRWTEPADTMGARVSQVTYKVHYENVSDWARSPQIAAAYPDQGKNLDAPFEINVNAVLMSDGWRIDGPLR